MRKKILIVDDDPKIVEYLSDLFADVGYATCSAGDSKEALEKAKQEKPNLITLDLEMPGEWGPRFYHKLLQDSELKKTPVIVISGLPGGKHAIPKAAASISKPFDRRELLETIRTVIGDA